MKTRRTSKSTSSPAGEVTVSSGTLLADAIQRRFPGPADARSPLRVAIDSGASKDVSDHARESPGAEICGVLVGNVCQDEQGIFTHITHALRGQEAAEGSTTVTFTQATWTTIHETMDREHAGRQIVGWYHSHPGFGVEFSDMDTFIQRNFFGGPAQIALVTDPTDGAVALAMNGTEGIVYLDRYWMDGKEQSARLPVDLISRPAQAGSTGTSSAALEDRIAQLTQAVDDLRSWMHWYLMVAAFIICGGFIALIVSVIRDQFRARITPSEVGSYVPIPVKVGDKTVMMGVGVVNWDVPPELNSILLEMAKEEAQAKQKKPDKDAKNAKNPGPSISDPTSGSTPAPVPSK